MSFSKSETERAGKTSTTDFTLKMNSFTPAVMICFAREFGRGLVDF